MVTARKRPKMTPQEAQSFDRYSIWNAGSAAGELRHSGACHADCEPYRDIYTYARWQALGYQVRRGEHGAKIAVIGQSTEEDADGAMVERSYRTTSRVFCRCQTEPIKGRGTS